MHNKDRQEVVETSTLAIIQVVSGSRPDEGNEPLSVLVGVRLYSQVHDPARGNLVPLAVVNGAGDVEAGADQIPVERVIRAGPGSEPGVVVALSEHLKEVAGVNAVAGQEIRPQFSVILELQGESRGVVCVH